MTRYSWCSSDRAYAARRPPSDVSRDANFPFFFFKQKTAYEIGLGIPAEPLFRSVKDCVTIDVLPRTPGNNVYVGFMVWSNFTATKCRGLVSLNQVIKEIICLQPLK